jgi:hypothetical protein
MNLDPKMGQDDYGRVTMQEMKGVRRDRKRKVIERAEEGTNQYDRGRL